MSTWNHFNLKRQAHSVSRSSRDQAWNPFRHVAWERPTRRADTWAAGIEDARTDGAELAHSRSAPLSSTAETGINERVLPRDNSTADTMMGSSAESAEKAALPRSLTDDKDAELRKRKPDDDQSDAINASNASEKDDNGKNKAPKKEGLIRHVTPKEPFTVRNQLQRTILSSWINLLIFAAPVGIALNYVKSVGGVVVFVVNFIAIIPLAAMLSFATEEIALRTGETLGGLLNASFGNAVELIVAIIALKEKKFRIVQTSLIGSILSNLLLVLGCCFFFGGLRRREQFFNETVAQTAASLLALAAASVIVPTVFDSAINTPTPVVASLSRGTAVILLIVYAAYLFFQLKTHQDVFNEESQKVSAKPWSSGSKAGGAIQQGLALSGGVMGHGLPTQNEDDHQWERIKNPPVNDEDEEEDPQLHFTVALVTLAVSTAIIALCAEYMVDSIDALTKQGHLKEEFVGLILLPIVGNAAEHATAVTVAMKDKMDLAIGVAIGSSMQVALFLIPLLVVIGWGMGFDEMNLSFDTFQVAVMFVSVLLTNYLIADGKSHWLEGFLLICLYAIIGVCAFFYPDPTGVDSS